MKPHKWAKEIKSWADGAEIECKWLNGSKNEKWFNPVSPDWDNKNYEFRIKPQPKEPQYLYVYDDSIYKDGVRTERRIILDNVWFEQWKEICLGKIKLEQDDD